MYCLLQSVHIYFFLHKIPYIQHINYKTRTGFLFFRIIYRKIKQAHTTYIFNLYNARVRFSFCGGGTTRHVCIVVATTWNKKMLVHHEISLRTTTPSFRRNDYEIDICRVPVGFLSIDHNPVLKKTPYIILGSHDVLRVSYEINIIYSFEQ